VCREIAPPIQIDLEGEGDIVPFRQPNLLDEVSKEELPFLVSGGGRRPQGREVLGEVVDVGQHLGGRHERLAEPVNNFETLTVGI
jgi:hypothetical protein